MVLRLALKSVFEEAGYNPEKAFIGTVEIVELVRETFESVDAPLFSPLSNPVVYPFSISSH